MKTGLGFDIHKLVEGRKLFLGGVEIPFSKGLLGHSDGDCLVHAIADALLGAMGKKDIGQLFPDTDPRYKDIRSTSILKEIVSMLEKQGLEIGNIDSVIIAEEPKLTSYIPHMKIALCLILHIKEEELGIKAKTNEGIGEIGQGEAIASWASVLLKQK
ncbi:MAG: 2-C-methyl-D-erythritol 2,4-cyclodiphosphate synthase [Acidobacteriota bacterium]|nr:2-C-methyl-D-erythritol 2,4-cyclodiphosphate synthase [Acidobacteriota bacterium]